MRKNAKIRVFHLVSHFDLGGAEQVALDIASSGSEDMEYHLVEVMRGRSAYTSGYLSRLRAAGIHPHRSLMPDVRFHFLFERVAALLFPLRWLWLWLRWRPDVVHTHTEAPDLCVLAVWTAFPWLRKGMHIVRTLHNVKLWTGQAALGKRAEHLFRQQGANVAISPSVQEAYEAAYGERPRIVCNGVERQEPKSYEGLAKDKINIVFAGRMEPQKGIDTLIAIVRKHAASGRYHFHLFGEGSLRHRVESELGALEGVSLHAPQRGLAAMLGSFHYLLMPSEFEGMGLLAVEAALAGTPPIVNLCPGLRDTVPPDWPLCARNNAMADYDRLFLHVLPTADRTVLAARAATFAEPRFSMKAMRAAYEALYRAVRNVPAGQA